MFGSLFRGSGFEVRRPALYRASTSNFNLEH